MEAPAEELQAPGQEELDRNQEERLRALGYIE